MIENLTFEVPEEVMKMINEHYPSDSLAYKIYTTHVVKVTELALKIADHNPNLNLNREYIIKAAMLHDIGIIKTDAPALGCFGNLPYIAHTYKGREMLEEEGMIDIAPICERHLGTGLSKQDIIDAGFPLPRRNMMPITKEEKLICYADKFYSKSAKHLTIPKTRVQIRRKISKYGEDKREAFDELVRLFGIDYIHP